MSKLQEKVTWFIENFLVTRRRKLTGNYLTIVKIIGFLLAFFYIYTGFIGMISPESHRGVFYATTLALVFLYFPARKSSPMDRFTIWDSILAVLSLSLGTYFILNYADFVYRAGDYTDLDKIFGWLAIILSLEAARRATGVPLPVISFIMILYTSKLVGPSLPGLWAHKGFDLNRISAFLFTTNEGVFGSVTYILATYVMPFVIFGAVLKATGAAKFFINLPYSIFGSKTGGTAMVAVFAGLLMGMISGSPVASVLAIGTFLTPLMTQVNYKPEVSGGIITASSSGAMFMPPVMGSAAFFMVEFTGIPYIKIMEIAFWPALLFYFGLIVQVILHAKKNGITGVNREDLPDWKEVLKGGWYFVIPLAALVIFLIMGYSPTLSALSASVVCLVVSFLNRQNGINLKKLYDALAGASRDILIIASLCGAVGIIIGLLGLSGLSHKFTQILITVGGSNLLLVILMTAIAATILGMASNIATVYIILAVLIPPALMRLGVSKTSSHFLLIWFSQLSGITPPVCLVAYAAAAISNANPFKTGLAALKYGSLLIIIPLLFVYTDILDIGTAGWYMDYFTGFIAVFFFAVFLQGYLVRKNKLLETILYGVSAVMLFTPLVYLNVIGFVVGAALLVFQFRTRSRTNPDLAA